MQGQSKNAGIEARDPLQGVITVLGPCRDGWSMVENLVRASRPEEIQTHTRATGTQAPGTQNHW